MSFNGYKYKFRLNVSHSINSTIENMNPHSHTLEVTLYMKQETKEFIGYEEVEKKVEEYLKAYMGNYLNNTEPFDKIDPTIENIGNEFYEKIQYILKGNKFKLLKLDISETPTRIYSVSDTSALALVNDQSKVKKLEALLKENRFVDVPKMEPDENEIKVNENIMVQNNDFQQIQNHKMNDPIVLSKFIDENTYKLNSKETIHKESKKYFFTKLAVALAFLLICSCGLMIYVKNSGLYPRGSDIYGHIFKSNLLYESIKNGNVYPMYSSLWYNGIQPFRYWAPIPYYILAGLQFLVGGDAMNSYIVFVGVAFFLGAAGWVLFGIKNNRIILSIVLGILWFLLPDNMRVFFSEGNFPRMVITVLLPYLFYFIWNFIEHKKKTSILFIIFFMSTIVLCHVMIAAMIGITSFVFVFIYSILNKRAQESIHVIIGMLLCFALVGLWLYPALQGGLMGMDSSSTSEVMKLMSSKVSSSLNPFLRLNGQIETYYYGLSIFLISIIGLFLSNKKSMSGFLTALIIFAGTTTVAVPLISKLPLNQLFWMQRFTPIAYAIFLLAILEWKRCKKFFVALFCLLIIIDMIPSLKLIEYPLDQKMPTTYERQAKIANDYSFTYAKSITNQRLSLLDLSASGSFSSYQICTNEPKTQYTYGWAWQGASTSSNIVMLNTALEKGYYNYLFDKCIEMGSDTVVIRKELFKDSEATLEQLNESANLLGFKLTQNTQYSFVFNKQTPKSFGVVSRYEGLAIGSSATDISLLFPYFQKADKVNLDDYTFDDLKNYKKIYLSGFKYKSRESAEKLVTSLTDSGVEIYVDMNKIPVDSTTNRMKFLGVTAQQITFNEKYPDILYENKFIQSNKFKEEYSKWNTVYLDNLPNTIASCKFNDETLGVIGTGENKNLVYIGLNILYHSVETKDKNVTDLVSNILKVNEDMLPSREIVPIDINYEKSKIVINSPMDDLNTTIAYQDNFRSDKKLVSENNLLTVNKGITEINLVYPYLKIGLIISIFGAMSTVIFLYYIFKNKKTYKKEAEARNEKSK